MRPTDALPQDWSRYYDGGFMEHSTMGIVEINVVIDDATGRPAFRVRNNVGVRWRAAQPDALFPVWPDSGCFNLNNNGFCAMRGAVQNIKRTANMCHYMVAYDVRYPHSGTNRISRDQMWEVVLNHSRPSVAEAQRLISTDQSLGLAVSPDIIIAKTKRPNCFAVVYHDVLVGILDQGLFVAKHDGSPMTKRARIKLQEIYPECL